jgi:uncharacterized protein YggU (UPF0235/DUF167 family)
MAAYRVEANALVLTVRLTPKAAEDAIDGVGTLSDGRMVVRARVRAVPEKGAANAALEALIAKSLKRPKSSVEVIAGGTARLKQVRVAGDPAEMAPKIEAWLKR